MLRRVRWPNLEDGKPFPVELADTSDRAGAPGQEVHALRDECTHAEIAWPRASDPQGPGVLAARVVLRPCAPAHRPRRRHRAVAVYAVTVAGEDVLVDPAVRTN